MNLCECGCGRETKYSKRKKRYNDWICGHNKSMLGRCHSEETKQEISNGNKGKVRSKEIKLKMSFAQIGANRSEETILKLSLANKGKYRSEITKQKISLAKMGTHHTEQSKQLIREARLGTYHSEKAKHKMSLAKRGNSRLREQAQKLGWAQKGKCPSIKCSYGKHSICNASYKVRSSYERDFSDGMYALNIKHIYEPERFYFGRYSYLPDYFIPELNLYIELKGYMRPKDVILHRMFIKTGHNLIVLDGKFFREDKLFERVLQMIVRIAQEKEKLI